MQVGKWKAGGWAGALLPLVRAPPTGGPEFEVCSGRVQASALLLGPPYRDGAAQPNSAFIPPLPPPLGRVKNVFPNERSLGEASEGA